MNVSAVWSSLASRGLGVWSGLRAAAIVAAVGALAVPACSPSECARDAAGSGLDSSIPDLQPEGAPAPDASTERDPPDLADLASDLLASDAAEVGPSEVGGPSDGAAEAGPVDARPPEPDAGDAAPAEAGVLDAVATDGPRPDGLPDLAPPDLAADAPVTDGGGDAVASPDADAAMVVPDPFGFYVSSSTGQDSGPGTLDHPWKTLAKVSAATFKPGATIYLRRGDRWEENLTASSSGTPDAPITYDAYGTGDAPTIVGSDLLPRTDWSPGPAYGTWFTSRSVANCVTENDALFRSTILMNLQDTDPSKNLATLAATPGTFYFDGQNLYVHTDVDPRLSGKTYRACARESLFSSNYQSYVTVRNLTFLDSAHFNGGYAALAIGGMHVTFEDLVAKRAGKHHISALETDAFVGRRLLGMEALADQGLGGATTFVHFGGLPQTSYQSDWIDCEAFAGADPYPSFITHGPGVGRVYLDRLKSHGFGPILNPGKASAEIRVRGGVLDGGFMDVDTGDNVVIDGMFMTGRATIEIWSGKNAVVQNVTMLNGSLDWHAGWPGAIRTSAEGTKILFNTLLAPGPSGAGIAVDIGSAKSIVAVGNIVDAAYFVRQSGKGTLDLTSDHNMFQVAVATGDPEQSVAQWQAAGRDTHSFAGSATFVDRAHGDLHPCAGTLGTGQSGFSALPVSTPLDADGKARGPSYDLGSLSSRPCGAATAAAR